MCIQFWFQQPLIRDDHISVGGAAPLIPNRAISNLCTGGPKSTNPSSSSLHHTTPNGSVPPWNIAYS